MHGLRFRVARAGAISSLARVAVWGCVLCGPMAFAQVPSTDWIMAGANPGRTSWVSSEVRGNLSPVWSVPIEPYVAPRTQVVATAGRIYLSTSRGLYCFDATRGQLQWIYPTRFPLGHSPTVVGGTAYVGGLDRRIHAVNATTGRRVWTSPQAGAGFQTNPLVLNGRVIAGNRDGYLYAYDAASGSLLWTFGTDGPILFSAAAYDGRVYFASNDSHAYAVTEAGELVWKSAKLPGSGFHSWWPVVFRDPGGDATRDRIIISGSVNYRAQLQPGGASPSGEYLHTVELLDLYPARQPEPVGVVGAGPGPWAAGTPTLTASRILDYFARKPHRRTVFVLDPHTGAERETAPVLIAGTHSGTRFPAVVGHDGALYQQMNHLGNEWIARGSVGAWAPGVGYIAPATADPRSSEFAVDEPVAAAAGGKVIYAALCCDRSASAYDVTDRSQRWMYYNYNLSKLVPGYNAAYFWNERNYSESAITVPFGASGNGVYGIHGDQNPPIPYNGRVYFHRGNSLIALGPAGTALITHAPAPIAAPPTDDIQPNGTEALVEKLEAEIRKILAAGHLRPGYASHGLFNHAGRVECGDRLSDYWHTPAENLYPLLKALPYLSAATAERLRSYLREEIAAFPPHATGHIGWQGAAREIFDTPPEVTSQMSGAATSTFNWDFHRYGGWGQLGVWGRNPILFYVLWKYAQTFGDASTLYDDSKGALETPPSDVVLIKNPYAANAFIAGYWGFLELEKLAGRRETEWVRTALNTLLALRKTTFSKDSSYKGQGHAHGGYCQQMAVATNFMYLVPELADYLRINILPQVQDAVREYELLAPDWMVAFTANGLGENSITPMHDVHALFQAKALILRAPATELEKYLDVPGFWRGDMYFLMNLVTILEAYGRSGGAMASPPHPPDDDAHDGR
jgi:hypothetical protein